MEGALTPEETKKTEKGRVVSHDAWVGRMLPRFTRHQLAINHGCNHSVIKKQVLLEAGREKKAYEWNY